MAPKLNSQIACDLLRAENRALRKLTLAERAACAQALVRKHVPDGVSLSAELIADRRREAKAEGE
ncbi:MAG: hypothetical protein WBW84_14760 [Acidobacteriaceae bacterium]